MFEIVYQIRQFLEILYTVKISEPLPQNVPEYNLKMQLYNRKF